MPTNELSKAALWKKMRDGWIVRKSTAKERLKLLEEKHETQGNCIQTSARIPLGDDNLYDPNFRSKTFASG